MVKNSIEEDIKILEEFKTHGYATLLIKYEDRNKANRKLDQALEHILSDYKKLQEEFKAVDSECSRLERKEVEQEKTIDLMAEHIFYNQSDKFPIAYSIKDTKDYFKNKAKEVK